MSSIRKIVSLLILNNLPVIAWGQWATGRNWAPGPNGSAGINRLLGVLPLLGQRR